MRRLLVAVLTGILFVDTLLLRLCTKFSHALQRATGLTCYFVAKVGCGIVAISVVKIFLSDGSRHWVAAFFIFIWVTDMIYRTIQLGKIEDHFHSAATTKHAFVKHSDSIIARIIWLLFFALDVILRGDLGNKGLSFGLLVFYYFVAVDPMPPGKSKVREWIENLGRKQVLVESKS